MRCGLCRGFAVVQSFITIANPVRFAVLYSFGNLVSLAATMFLMGPVKQFKNMFDEKRRVATIVYLSALVATLVIALWQGKKLGTSRAWCDTRTRDAPLPRASPPHTTPRHSHAGLMVLLRCLSHPPSPPCCPPPVILVLLLVVVQFLALIWYTLSYIPYGRTVAASAVTGCFKK